MASSNFPNRPFGLREACWLSYQEIGNNRSNVHGELWIDQYNGNYNTYSLGANSSFQFYLNGSLVGGWSFGYDFRAYDNLHLIAVDVWIGHNADGTKYFAIDGYANVDIMGYTEVHSGITLPTIPRASTATWAVPGDAVAGVGKQLNTNRASTAFTHDIDYFFGSLPQTRALTGIGDSGVWTPPLSLLNQIPNATRGAARFRTHTYNGGSMIGWTESSFAITAAEDIVPNWTSATIVDATAGITAIIGSGRYLQNISKLTGTITGAAGVYSSTISSYKQAVGTETINAATANFTKVLPTAGTAVPVTQEITDSRGRKKTLVTNIHVMPYANPVVSSWSVQRSDPAGVPASEGTSLRINITAAVQSVINTTERNRMTVQIYTKLRTDTTWTLQATPVSDSTTLAYNSFVVLAGPFAVDDAYDVRVDVTDKFKVTSVQNSAGVGRVYMHWGDPGFGLGKYYERGMLDIQGHVYTRGSFWADNAGSALETGYITQNPNTFSWQGRFAVRPTGTPGWSAPVNLPAIPDATTFQWVGEQYLSSVGGSVWRRVQRIWPVSDENMRLGGVGTRRFIRYLDSAGVSWTSWRKDDPAVMWPAQATSGSTWNWMEGRVLLPPGIKTFVMDGVFTTDFIKYRIDYYYYTGTSNGAWFKFRSGAADISTGYNYQLMYISGTGTPAGAAYSNQTQVGFAANANAGHHGHFEIYNPMHPHATTIQKGFSGQEQGSAGITNFGGWLGAQDNTAIDGFRIQLSDQAAGQNGFVAGSWISVKGVA